MKEVSQPYYGVFVDVKERRCLVFGGDAREGERKVNGLLDCGADVVLFAQPDNISPTLEEKAQAGEIEWVRRGYSKGDLEGAWIAIVADTSNSSVNKDIYEESKRRNVMLNVMDVTHLCTFIAPALTNRGPVTAAVSTGGASPALARRLREEMSGKSCSCMRWADAGDILAKVRATLRNRGVIVCPDRWQEVMTPAWLDKANSVHAEDAERELLKDLTAADCEVCRPYGHCMRLVNRTPE